MDKIIQRKEKMPLKRKLFILSVVTVPLLSFAIFFVYMNFSSFFLAFQKYDLAGNKSWVGLENFTELFKSFSNNGIVWVALKNSLKGFWIQTIICYPLQIIFSYYIYKKLPAEKVISIVVLLPQVVGTFIFALAYKKFVEIALPNVMVSLGIMNFPQIITNDKYMFFNNLFYSSWCGFGTSMLMYSNAMFGVDREIIESSMIDGANDATQFIKIILPLILPTLTTTFIASLTTMFTWSGALMTFYMYDAKPHVYGLGYYFTVTVANNSQSQYLNYPMVATSGLLVTLMTVPVVFGFRALLMKLDKTE